MARKNRDQYRAGAFDWPSQSEDSAIGPDWSGREARQKISDPWADSRFAMHLETAADRKATGDSESALWPAGEAERSDIGLASPDALQAAHSNVDVGPLAAAAAEIAALNREFAAPAMTREDASVADAARHDQAAARLAEIAKLELWLQTPGDTPHN